MAHEDLGETGGTGISGIAELADICHYAPDWVKNLLRTVITFPEFDGAAEELNYEIKRRATEETLQLGTEFRTPGPLAQFFASSQVQEYFNGVPDFSDLVAQRITRCLENQSPAELAQFFAQAFRDLNGENRAALAMSLGMRVGSLGLDHERFGLIWQNLFTASREDTQATQDLFMLYFLRHYTSSWVENQGWRLNETELLESLFEVRNLRVEARGVKKTASKYSIRSFTIAVSEFHEDQILTSLVRDSLKGVGFRNVFALQRGWGDLDTYDYDVADFGLKNDADWTTKEFSQSQSIYAFKGYHVFAREEWLRQGLQGEAVPDSVQSAVDRLLSGDGTNGSSSKDGMMIDACAWLALKGGVKIGFPELSKPLVRAATRAAKGGNCTARFSVQEHNRPGLSFDLELEEFLKGKTSEKPVNVFMGGAVHARMLKRWWAQVNGIIELLDPRDFQLLIRKRRWPPNNHLVSSQRTNDYEKLRDDLSRLYLAIGDLLVRAANNYTPDSAAGRIIRHLITVLLPIEVLSRQSKWNFVTCEDDMIALLTEDDVFHGHGRRKSL